MTSRRKFITLLGAAAAWPLAARAQQPGKLPTIGFLGQSTRSATSEWTTAFVQRLRELGWIDGRNVAIEYRWGEGRDELFAQIAAEFVRSARATRHFGGAPHDSRAAAHPSRRREPWPPRARRRKCGAGPWTARRRSVR